MLLIIFAFLVVLLNLLDVRVSCTTEVNCSEIERDMFHCYHSIIIAGKNKTEVLVYIW